MNDAKYIGLDVHQATISATVLDSSGKLVMESILETKAETILQFLCGLRGSLHVTLEEGACAGWLHDLLKPHVTQVLVCDPRKNALLKVGNRAIASIRGSSPNCCAPIFSGPFFTKTRACECLKELARSYMTITKDLTRVMVRLKALYRSWAIPCAGRQKCTRRAIALRGSKITETGVRRRAEMYYQQLDALLLFCTSKRGERCWPRARKYEATKLLRPDPLDRVQFVQLSCSRSYKHRTGFAPSGNSGPITVWR